MSRAVSTLVVDYNELSDDLRISFTPEQRTADMEMSIDPGFVQFRKIETTIGKAGMRYVDEAIRNLPDLPEWMRKTRIAHIYREAIVTFCAVVEIPTLSEVLAKNRGRMFCSTEELAPAPEVYREARAVSRIITPGVTEPHVELHYSTEHIIADTTRSELQKGDSLAVVAELHKFQGGKLIFYPLLIGAPWLVSKSDPPPFDGPEWYSWSFFENFIEDIDEFAAVTDIEPPADFAIMEKISEAAFKQCLTEILGDTAKVDWGGETSDHFTSHLRLKGKRITAAFLLKGPGSRFKPMTLNHLGKNNDQINRLAQEPAGLLVVQHCHEILPAVRGMLRAFAVQPGSARRYCLIDGRDSLRLLMAHGKLERALDLSSKSGAA
jgi:hypothetical protein